MVLTRTHAGAAWRLNLVAWILLNNEASLAMRQRSCVWIYKWYELIVWGFKQNPLFSLSRTFPLCAYTASRTSLQNLSLEGPQIHFVMLVCLSPPQYTHSLPWGIEHVSPLLHYFMKQVVYWKHVTLSVTNMFSIVQGNHTASCVTLSPYKFLQCWDCFLVCFCFCNHNVILQIKTSIARYFRETFSLLMVLCPSDTYCCHTYRIW